MLRSFQVRGIARAPFAAEDPAGSLIAEAPAQYRPGIPIERRFISSRNFCAGCRAKRSVLFAGKLTPVLAEEGQDVVLEAVRHSVGMGAAV